MKETDSQNRKQTEKRGMTAGRLFFSLAAAGLGMVLLFWCSRGNGGKDFPFTLLSAGCALIFLIALAVRRLPKGISIPLLVGIPIASFYLLELLTHDPRMIRWEVLLLEFAFYLLLFGFFFAVTGRMKVGYGIAVLLVAFIGMANYYVLNFRSNPILPWDIASLGTALSVADNFVFEGNERVCEILLGYLLLFVLAVKCDLRIKTGKVRLFWAALLFICSFVYYRAVQTDEVKKATGIYEMPFTQWYVYQKNGFFVSFIINARYLDVEVPEGYSPQEAREELYRREFSEEPVPEPEEKPNIIVVMDEAFSDLHVLGDFETNKALIPFIESLMASDEVISGNLAVSVLGGNTANTEFEFLTGLSTAFLPAGSIPYQQFVRTELPSLATILKEYGYETLAMHPYGARGWNRDLVYPRLGFERMMFRDDFEERAGLRSYISDGSVVRQIIREYEDKKEGQPLFAFAVTMQNHGSYFREYENFTSDVRVTSPKLGRLPKAEQYLSLIRWTDAAMKKLVEYFREQDEKTIIVFFGDHQPALLENAFFKALMGKVPNALTWQEQVPRYFVPFFIWANYDLGEIKDTGVTTSVNYLQTYLMEAAGLPKTDFQNYLTVMRKELPILTAGFYFDSDGTLKEITVESIAAAEKLQGYARLQYNDLFDIDNRLEGFYVSPSGEMTGDENGAGNP